jgi:superfamily II DNA or RNA helicase
MEIPFNGKLRPHQEEVKPEVMNALSKHGSCILSGWCAFGKCLGIDTPVMMADGTICPVQDIEVGDQIMGDDSTPRNVLSLSRGQEQMYRIVPRKGDPFTANESHILSLKIMSNRTIINSEKSGWVTKCFNHATRKFEHRHFRTDRAAAEKHIREYRSSNILDIDIRDYLAMTPTLQKYFLLYRVGVDFPKTSVPIDPYLLGIWLGDGHSNTTGITTVDKEVIEYLTAYCDENGMALTQGKGRSAITYSIIDPSRRGNRLMSLLRENNLLQNKHIPHMYKRNDRRTRLELLAGLIDSDGYYHGGCYEITQKRKVLADDIVYLARSLGLAAYVSAVEKSCTYKGKKKIGVYHRVGLHGPGVDEIPCLLSRKQASPWTKPRDVMCTSFTLEPVEETDYYGFTIDGNRRFLLGDFTVTHNTAVSINLACTIGLPTLIITPPTITLMKQWKKAIEHFAPSAHVEIIEGKSEKTEADFYVVSAANMEKKGHAFFVDAGFVIVDELHKVMAEKYSQGLWYVHPRYLLGLSATPYRLDELDAMIEMYFTQAGPQCMIVREQERPFQVNRVLTGIRPKVKLNPATRRVDWSSVVEWQATHEHRNRLIVSIVLENPDRTFLILVKLTSQADMLSAFLQEAGVTVASLVGKTQEYDRTARVLIGTIGKIGTGFDNTLLDGLILGTSVKNYFRQYVGRVFRLEEVEPVVFDIVDKHGILDRHFESRREEYVSLGGTVRDVELETQK